MSVPLDPRVLINYYLRKGWYDHVQRLCESILEKKGSDPTVMFWRAFGIVLERSYSSAIRELENLKKRKEVELPCLHALIYAHNQCKHVDHEEIAQFELQVCMAEESATEHSLLLCANFFWHLKEHAKARKLLEQLTGVNGRPGLAKDPIVQQRAIVLRGWVDLTVEPKTKRDADLRDGSIQFFEQVKEYVLVSLSGWSTGLCRSLTTAVSFTLTLLLQPQRRRALARDRQVPRHEEGVRQSARVL